MKRGQTGASLVVVLAFMVFVSLLVPAILGLTFTGLRVSAESAEQRDVLYAAGSGIELAVAAATAQDPRDSSSAEECSEVSIELDGATVKVACKSHPELAEVCGAGSRLVTYLAEAVRGSQSERVAAQVVYQQRGRALQATVTDWDASASGMTDPDKSACDWPVTTTTAPTTTTTVAPPTTTTTSTTVAPSTTSTTAPGTTTSSTIATTTTTTPPTTTTTVPRDVLTARWASVRSYDKGKKWFADATVQLDDPAGGHVRGVRVVASIEYRSADGRWVEQAKYRRTANSKGLVKYRSPRYVSDGSGAVDEVRFTILDVEDRQGRSWDAGAFPVQVNVRAP